VENVANVIGEEEKVGKQDAAAQAMATTFLEYLNCYNSLNEVTDYVRCALAVVAMCMATALSPLWQQNQGATAKAANNATHGLDYSLNDAGAKLHLEVHGGKVVIVLAFGSSANGYSYAIPRDLSI